VATSGKWPLRQKAESRLSADWVESMRPIVLASTGIQKNDRLSMGAERSDSLSVQKAAYR
jgi:hypothetical protein